MIVTDLLQSFIHTERDSLVGKAFPTLFFFIRFF